MALIKRKQAIEIADVESVHVDAQDILLDGLPDLCPSLPWNAKKAVIAVVRHILDESVIQVGTRQVINRWV